MSLIITGGQWRGRPIPTPKHDHIRPTTARMRESIFSQIQGFITGCRMLDGFSGTGVMALEALSRGAEFVLSVEKHRAQAHHLAQLAPTFGLNIDQWQIMGQPFERWVERPNPMPPFHWVYLDPPYSLITHQAVARWLAPLITHHWLASDGQVWLEHPSRYQAPGPSNQRVYGESTISQWTYADLAHVFRGGA